jgi:hypothetical protein
MAPRQHLAGLAWRTWRRLREWTSPRLRQIRRALRFRPPAAGGRRAQLQRARPPSRAAPPATRARPQPTSPPRPLAPAAALPAAAPAAAYDPTDVSWLPTASASQRAAVGLALDPALARRAPHEAIRVLKAEPLTRAVLARCAGGARATHARRAMFPARRLSCALPRVYL